MRECAAWITTGIWLASWLFLGSPAGIATFVIAGIAAFRLASE